MITAVQALAALCMLGAFTLEEKDGAVHVLEDGQPVLVYHQDMVEPPKKVDSHYRRSGYIHPLYGLDGEEMTQDFPFDHRHHRGLFWAWPDSSYGGRDLNIWLLSDVRSVHDAWIEKAAGERAVLAARNHWVYDDAPDAPIIEESVRMEIMPAQKDARAMDFTITLKNVGDETVIIRGAKADNKGYGGFCFRPDARRKPMEFTSAQGTHEDDLLELASPWADVSFPTQRKGDKRSGVAIFQHPGNPGYPHDGWIFRHYGFLGASWPHTTPHPLPPGDAFTLRYRVLVHRGSALSAEVPAAFTAWTESVQE